MRMLLIGRGKMGTLIQQTAQAAGDEVVAALGREDLGQLASMGAADVVIDFSRPETLDAVCAYVRRTRTPLLSGTTGYTPAQMAELEKAGVVRGYKALIDWDRTDRKYVTALIELRVTPQRNYGFDDLAERIMKFEEVETVYLMSGGFDLMVIVNGCTFKDVAMFVAKRLSTLDSVVSTATHFVLRRYKDRGVLFLGEDVDERGAL